MRTTIVRLAIAVLLAVGAWFSWSEARLAARMGDAAQQIATLRHADVDRSSMRAPRPPSITGSARYGAISADTNNADADAQVLRTAANAAFRASEREPLAGLRRRPAARRRAAGVRVGAQGFTA